MNNLLKSTVLAVSLSVGVGAQSASAATVSSIGESFTVSYNYLDTLIADLTWTVTNIVGDRWFFDVLIDNDSPNPSNNETNRITSFGFTTDPSATNVSATGDWDATTGGIQAGYQNLNIEACVYDGVNCNAGGGGPTIGVAGGEEETVSLAFDYGGGTELFFTDFATRWQSMSVSAPGGGDSMVLAPSPVPLPAAGWLLLVGVGGLVALKRRKGSAA